MSSVRNDPLEDTLVRTWDAFLATEERADAPGDPSATLVISEFTRIFGGIQADEHFLNNLERQLFGTGNYLDSMPAVQIAPTIAPSLAAAPAAPTPLWKQDKVRNLTNWLSMAALLALILAGVAVIYLTDRNGEEPESGLLTAPETPISVDRRGYALLLDSTVDGRSLYPSEAPPWDEAYFAALVLEPGASISTDNPHIRCCDGIQVITVVTGTLSVQMSQPISVNQADGTVLVSVGSVSLKPGDSAIYQGEMTAHNFDNRSATLLVGGAFAAPTEPRAAESESGLTVRSESTTPISFDPGAALSSIDIDEINIAGGHVVQLDVTPNDAALLVTSGGTLRLGRSQTDPAPVEFTDAFALSELGPGRYWLSTAESNPVFIYILRIGPDLVPTHPEA